jgi:hypothetical protein
MNWSDSIHPVGPRFGSVLYSTFAWVRKTPLHSGHETASTCACWPEASYSIVLPVDRTGLMAMVQ